MKNTYERPASELLPVLIRDIQREAVLDHLRDNNIVIPDWDTGAVSILGRNADISGLAIVDMLYEVDYQESPEPICSHKVFRPVASRIAMQYAEEHLFDTDLSLIDQIIGACNAPYKRLDLEITSTLEPDDDEPVEIATIFMAPGRKPAVMHCLDLLDVKLRTDMSEDNLDFVERANQHYAGGVEVVPESVCEAIMLALRDSDRCIDMFMPDAS